MCLCYEIRDLHQPFLTFIFCLLQSSFVNRAALGLYPPVTFLQDLKEALISVS